MHLHRLFIMAVYTRMRSIQGVLYDLVLWLGRVWWQCRSVRLVRLAISVHEGEPRFMLGRGVGVLGSVK